MRQSPTLIISPSLGSQNLPSVFWIVKLCDSEATRVCVPVGSLNPNRWNTLNISAAAVFYGMSATELIVFAMLG